MLIELYEKCGDAIAQQYAGSQLVHRVDTYGKNSLASQSRDMIHTISRYYRYFKNLFKLKPIQSYIY
jgi:hypothetical protein